MPQTGTPIQGPVTSLPASWSCLLTSVARNGPTNGSGVSCTWFLFNLRSRLCRSRQGHRVTRVLGSDSSGLLRIVHTTQAATKVRLPPALRVVAPNGQQRSAGDYARPPTTRGVGRRPWDHRETRAQGGRAAPLAYLGLLGHMVLNHSMRCSQMSKRCTVQKDHETSSHSAPVEVGVVQFSSLSIAS